MTTNFITTRSGKV